MTDYILGNRIRVTASFVDTTGAAIDPTTVTLRIKRHKGAAESVYVYATDAEVVKDSTGQYHAVIEPDQVGWWLYRWTGSGTAVSATEGSFRMVKDYH